VYYVYILFSKKDNKLYTGYTPDLKKRFLKHKNGYVKATKHRRPVILVYYEAYTQRLDAKRREMYLKGGKGKSGLKVQLKEVFSKLQYKYR